MPQGLYATPFSRAYWKQAAAEFRATRTLVFAALMIALRVLFKTVSIPVGADLRINTAFLINAFGAMVFGPVVAIAAAAVTDTLGCILFPTGVYFFPFVFVEIAGSLLFALFLYRARLTARRVILCRFSIDFFVNIVLNTPIMMLYYRLILGKYYTPVDLPRIVKNLVLFPVESALLILFLRLSVPPLHRAGYVADDAGALRFTRKSALGLAGLFVAGCLAVGGYALWHYNNTSLSASYTQEQRTEYNRAMTEQALSRDSSLLRERTVAIVESAIPHFPGGAVSWEIAVYEIAPSPANEAPRDPEAFFPLSKSKARSETALRLLYNVRARTQSPQAEPILWERVGENA